MVSVKGSVKSREFVEVEVNRNDSEATRMIYFFYFSVFK